jgi:hypothetical protein
LDDVRISSAGWFIGDQPSYHAAIRDVAGAPGIIILHDYVMYHLSCGLFDQRRLGDRYGEAMRRWYGLGSSVTRPEKGWRIQESNEVVRYPLFEEAVLGIHGVVAHAEFVKEAVRHTTGCPVVSMPLASTAREGERPLSRKDIEIPEDRLAVVTVKNVNENKRVRVVLEALAANPDLARLFCT